MEKHFPKKIKKGVTYYATIKINEHKPLSKEYDNLSFALLINNKQEKLLDYHLKSSTQIEKMFEKYDSKNIEYKIYKKNKTNEWQTAEFKISIKFNEVRKDTIKGFIYHRYFINSDKEDEYIMRHRKIFFEKVVEVVPWYQFW